MQKRPLLSRFSVVKVTVSLFFFYLFLFPDMDLRNRHRFICDGFFLFLVLFFLHFRLCMDFRNCKVFIFYILGFMCCLLIVLLFFLFPKHSAISLN